MPHTVTLDQFEGPLDLLLCLIEQEELDITSIALARVCEEYLAHLKQVEDRSPEEVADFLVIAAKLLYLKSLLLVPGTVSEAEVDATGLAEQLRIYRAFVEASHGIEARYHSGVVLYEPVSARLTFLQEKLGGFIPPPHCDVEALRTAFAHIIAELEPIVRIPRAVVGRVISIDDRIAEIRRLVTTQPQATFDDVLRGRRGRDEAIVSFLAILELVKRQVIDVEQDARFAPIRIERISESTPYAEATIDHI